LGRPKSASRHNGNASFQGFAAQAEHVYTRRLYSTINILFRSLQNNPTAKQSLNTNPGLRGLPYTPTGYSTGT
jgi:hypothetical protein